MDGGLLHYINPAHAISLLSSLNEERMKEQLCDVILIVGDQKFRAHKNILAASSEYFHSLFTNKNNDSQTVFQLDFCEADAFENVLSYIYSSSLFVEKGSLAAVQELGYSLGITFLTNILSKTPQAPFCPPKKAAFSEDEENGSQQRSVIVCQSQNEARDVGRVPHDISSSSKPSSSSQGKSTSAKQHLRSADTLNSLYSKRNWRGSSNNSDDINIGGWMKRNAQKKTFPADSAEDQQAADMHLMRGNTSEAFKKKMAHVPALLSLTDSPYPMQKPGKDITVKQEDRNLHYYSQLGAAVPSAAPGKQTIDRSGPLVKSLLRRSLSMDSEVPSYSHDADFQASQGGPSIEDASKDAAPDGCSRKTLLKRARDAAQDKNADRGKSFASTLSSSRDSFQNDKIQIKTEPQSPPPSEPAEIIRVTVGDAAQASNCDVGVKMEETPEASSPPAKRRFHSDRRMLASRRAKAKASTAPEPETSFDRRPSHLEGDFYDSDDSKEMCIDTQEVGQARKFKCKHCLKIFRSTAGLNRHINMYHNPEKPYACDICNKRFHTNFKVWTHCQTQHGIVKNPSPASSAHGVLDEKFQRKLIDIVREREIKKALMYKLRRGKQGYQGPSGSQAQAMKRSLRSRSKAAYVCNYCGKSYRFLSQLKQHAKMHPVDKAALSKNIRPKKSSSPKSPVESKEVFHCRLCNATLSSFVEQGNHERMCRNATLCPYCSLRFSSPELKTEHEAKCEYKKLTCLECMRTFKSSFSIWRHQVEVHNQNTMAPTENLSLPLLNRNGETSKAARQQLLLESRKVNSFLMPKDDPDAYSDSSEHMNFDSDDSNCLPEDLSMSKRFNAQIKDEPADDMEDEPDSSYVHKEATSDSEGGMWSCEKCGKIFTVHKQLERHQELLCSVKPFICHVCNKAFRTNFRLWSHFQSHMAQGEEASFRESDACAPVSSPSPPPLHPPPPPLPKIQPIEPETTASYPEKHSPPEKKFAPQESETLFYHAPPLSAITFKRQFMCKLCHRTFKTAFSLWSHEQTHN